MATCLQFSPVRLQSSTLLDQIFTLMRCQHKSRFPQDWLVSGRQPRHTTVKTSVRKITFKTWKQLSLKFLFMKIGKVLPSQPTDTPDLLFLCWKLSKDVFIHYLVKAKFTKGGGECKEPLYLWISQSDMVTF